MKLPVQLPQPVDSFQTTTYHLPGFTESGVQVFNNLAGPLYQVPAAMTSTNGPSTYHQDQASSHTPAPSAYQTQAAPAAQLFPGSYASQAQDQVQAPDYSTPRAPAPAYPRIDTYASPAQNYAYSNPAPAPAAFPAPVPYNAAPSPGPSVPPPALFNQPSLPKQEPPKPNIIKKSDSLSYQASANPYSAPSTPLSAAPYKSAPSPLVNKYSLGAPPPKASGAANPFAKHKPTDTPVCFTS